ncbi:uncharacterized protein FSUBG_9620 [Fusarium subglutinans]|uniref:WSC domain-containing protein n=1 Tax=Gibberella subglutinans TaxID=42677 RepID=A0A8H5UP12_GIBSU|nr:uncharacterized protein FSUBG_9620 [Fusarium subglutinans]KAF5594047.1 hypothetical protein FSUBG_9620 [Fusarium subglutinans]
MRLSTFLLAACASSAFGQFNQNFKRFTNTSIPATTTTGSVPSSIDTSASTTSSTAPSSAPISLGTAQLGAGASYTTALDGSAAVSLFIRNGVATFRLVPFLASFAGLRVFVVFSILVRPPPRGLKRQVFDGCTLEVQVDGQTIYQEVMSDTGGSEVGQRSNPVRLDAEGRPDLQYFLTCGSDAVEVVVSHLSFDQAGEDAQTTPIAPLPTGTETPGGTNTNSEGFTTNSEGETVSPPGTNSAGFTTNSDGETIFPTGTDSAGFTTNSNGETVFPTGANSAGFTTNSDGETIFPPSTNSAGFTTNSNGETVFPTGTNSAGFTTNSNGETIFPTGTATGTEDETSAPTATSLAGFPDFIDAFALFGCVGSSDGFPTFELAESDTSMDLDQCSTLCQGRAYFGVYDTDCYCGDEIDGEDTTRVELDSCDIECPGDVSQFCGGDSQRRRMHRRQTISSDRLLTVYVSAGGQTDVVTDEVTRTVTDQSTFVTTFATTVAGPVTTATERVVYIFVEAECGACNREWVYIPEVCDCQGGFQYVPHFCFGGSCSGKTVYKSQECHDWWNHKDFYVPADCEECSGGEIIYKPWENSWGTPENCKPEEIPACEGHRCPPVYPTNNKGQNGGGGSDHGGSSKPGMHHGGSDSGSNGGSSYGGHSKGSDDNGSKGDVPGCTGDECTGPYDGESGSKPNGSHESSGGDTHGEPAPGSKPTGPAEGSGSHSEPAPGGEPTGAPVVISGAGNQVANFFVLLAAIAPALL